MPGESPTEEDLFNQIPLNALARTYRHCSLKTLLSLRLSSKRVRSAASLAIAFRHDCDLTEFGSGISDDSLRNIIDVMKLCGKYASEVYSSSSRNCINGDCPGWLAFTSISISGCKYGRTKVYIAYDSLAFYSD